MKNNQGSYYALLERRHFSCASIDRVRNVLYLLLP